MDKWKKANILKMVNFTVAQSEILALHGIFHLVMFKIILRSFSRIEIFSKYEVFIDASFKFMILFQRNFLYVFTMKVDTKATAGIFV